LTHDWVKKTNIELSNTREKSGREDNFAINTAGQFCWPPAGDTSGKTPQIKGEKGSRSASACARTGEAAGNAWGQRRKA